MLSYKSREGIGILIGVSTLALSLSPYEVFYIALLTLSFLIGYEVSKAIGLKLFYAAPLTFIFSSISPGLGLLCALLISFYHGWRSWHFEDFLKSLLVSIYAGHLPMYLLNIKSIDGYALVKLIFFVWAVDVFSYYAGKKFGKNLLAPRLSPKKTWEGLMGGFLAGTISLMLFYGLKGLLWSPPMVAFALLGDLFKSYIKRSVGIKDFSNILGEHGGFTDRFDSLIFTAPLYLFLLKF
ncbi:MAG: phosphatidate cytidylyltransferase [Aquificaceae bacterium]